MVRCLRVDPGVVYTGMFKPFLPLVMEWAMVLTFYIVRSSSATPRQYYWLTKVCRVCSPDGSAQRCIPSRSKPPP